MQICDQLCLADVVVHERSQMLLAMKGGDSPADAVCLAWSQLGKCQPHLRQNLDERGLLPGCEQRIECSQQFGRLPGCLASGMKQAPQETNGPLRLACSNELSLDEYGKV